MPFLMINLDDPVDCKRSMRQLRKHIRQMEHQESLPSNPHAGHHKRCATERSHKQRQNDGTKITLPQKLQRIRRRGVWRFLAQIAQLSDRPRSLAELDAALELPRNKMRSTKAIFAKLENRLDIQFLVVDASAGEDDAGNPRYMMPKRIRRQILKLIE